MIMFSIREVAALSTLSLYLFMCISHVKSEVKYYKTNVNLTGSTLREKSWKFHVGDFKIQIERLSTASSHDIPWYLNIEREDHIIVPEVQPVEESSTVEPVVLTTASTSIVEDDEEYHELGSNSYKLVKTGKTKWHSANNRCRKDGAHLAVIPSKSEAELIKNFLTSHNVDDVFIGVSDQKKEGHFMTVLGTRLEETGFSEWAEGEPDNGGKNPRYGEDCVIFSKQGTLKDVRCDSRRRYLCQKPK